MGSVVHKYVWYSGKVLNEWDILSSPFVERKDTIVCVRHTEISIAIQLISIWCTVLSFLNNTECIFKDSLFKPKLCIKLQFKICPLTFKVSITIMFYWRKMARDETVVHRHSLNTCMQVTFRWVRHKSNFAQFRSEYIHGQVSGNSSSNRNSKITEPDRLQHDCPTACAIAPQYSSATSVWLHFHFGKE